jgi:hypothetical protein
MTPAQVATLALLDPDQGVCPEGHPCSLGDVLGDRECRAGEYVGLALICWSVTPAAVDTAERLDADPRIVAWAHSFVRDRG